MKLTKQQLREMILEELDALQSPIVNESIDMDVKVLNDSNPESLKAVVDGKQTTLSLENAEVLELVKGRFAEGIATYSSQDFQDHVFEFKVNLSLHGLEFEIVEVEELHQVLEA